MMSRMKRLTALIGLVFLTGACSGQEQVLPTPLPVAEVPTLAATRTSLPPTADLTAAASAPEPATAPATSTRLPAPTDTPESNEPGINITSPDANSDIVIGSSITAGGLLRLNAGQTAWLSLVTLNGQLLVETAAETSDGTWEAVLDIPQSVGGSAYLQASVRGAGGATIAANQVPVHLILDTARTDQYLALFRPTAGDAAMGGFNLFFDGRAQRPVDNTVTISVWSDECRTQVARQSFVLRGSGYWQGFVIIPNTVSGPGCAIAGFGAPGEESWREVHIPIEIAANDDASAHGIVIGNPPAGSSFTAGEEILLYGTAINADQEPIRFTLLLENGRIVNQSETQTDNFGYWELSIPLPIDVSGPAGITVSAGDPGEANYAESQVLISINPAP